MKTTASLIAIIISGGLIGAAQAADVYGPGSTKDAPGTFDAPQTVQWTGVYIGGSVGYGNSNHNLSLHDYFKDFCSDETGNSSFDPFTDGDRDRTLEDLNGTKLATDPYFRTSCEQKRGSGNPPVPVSTGDKTVTGDSREIASLDGVNAHGIVGDVRLGYDYAPGRFLVGIFGTYGFNGMEADASISGLGTASIEKGDEWSVGVRLGMLVNPRTLAYVLASYTQTEYEFSVAGLGGSASKDVDFDGVTVGGGVEFAVSPNVFLGIEGTHTFYGEETVFDHYDAGDNVGIRLNDDLGETKVMGTLKVKFGGNY